MNSRQNTIDKYGAINDQCVWVDQSKHMVKWLIPELILNNSDYRFVIPFLPEKPKVKSLYVNKAMTPFLSEAFDNIADRGLIGELKEFGGCFNIRTSRGSNNLSAHAWGLAIDINMTGNALGHAPTMNKELVACFEDAGFYWGGRYNRPDGMHFSIADFDKPSE